jgi:hypothetical protein
MVATPTSVSGEIWHTAPLGGWPTAQQAGWLLPSGFATLPGLKSICLVVAGSHHNSATIATLCDLGVMLSGVHQWDYYLDAAEFPLDPDWDIIRVGKLWDLNEYSAYAPSDMPNITQEISIWQTVSQTAVPLSDDSKIETTDSFMLFSVEGTFASTTTIAPGPGALVFSLAAPGVTIIGYPCGAAVFGKSTAAIRRTSLRGYGSFG